LFEDPNQAMIIPLVNMILEYIFPSFWTFTIEFGEFPI
jgi:hypothetical protein